ncbi:MAG TPA: rod shape-determining protein MreC [Chloroflexota bacterium]|nr:rod shape-determining protein MreC [Chloroflexota bacterium]
MARLHQDARALNPLVLGRGLLWLGVLASLSIGLIVLDQTHRLQPAENVASRAFTPLQSVLTQKTDALSGFLSTVGQITQLREENDRLRKEVAGLRLQNTELSRAEAENETMRAQLKYARANPQFALMPASVVGKDLHGLDDYIEIDRGGADGLQAQMTVLSPDGYLAGRILNLTEHRARVLIITNPSSSVAALVSDNEGQAEDVVDGHIHGRLQMTNIPQTVKVKIGDDVYTSGLGGNFPKGVKIGKIATLKNSDVQLFQQAEVAPYVDFGRLSAVEIVTNNLPPK